MTTRFISAALIVLCGLVLTAHAGDHTSPPQNEEPTAVAHESGAAAQRRKAALRAALLEQQAQQARDGQKQGGYAEAARPWTQQDRAELRQQIRQQNRGNSHP